jgi:uncharacterized integral membrane protein
MQYLTVLLLPLLLPLLLLPLRTQALWALGVVGAGYLLLSHPELPLPLLVAQQPWSVWLVGPAAAAVTGGATGDAACLLACLLACFPARVPQHPPVRQPHDQITYLCLVAGTTAAVDPYAHLPHAVWHRI